MIKVFEKLVASSKCGRPFGCIPAFRIWFPSQKLDLKKCHFISRHRRALNLTVIVQTKAENNLRTCVLWYDSLPERQCNGNFYKYFNQSQNSYEISTGELLCGGQTCGESQVFGTSYGLVRPPVFWHFFQCLFIIH